MPAVNCQLQRFKPGSLQPLSAAFNESAQSDEQLLAHGL
jgi:hypothetical protein